jgi:hypothetical protein
MSRFPPLALVNSNSCVIEFVSKYSVIMAPVVDIVLSLLIITQAGTPQNDRTAVVHAGNHKGMATYFQLFILAIVSHVCLCAQYSTIIEI